jgi:hypothetical protein
MDAAAVVLVEGTSDQVALEALARRRGRDLAREGVLVLAIGGAKNIRSFLEQFGPRGLDVHVAALCDAREEDDYRRSLAEAGVPAGGLHVCVDDLEDELIRALGVEKVERIIEAEGEMRAFRTFQRQAAQQGKRPEEQLRRFMGTKGGRKIRYGTLLVDALDLARVPAPLDGALVAVPSGAVEDLGGGPLS